VAGETVLIVDDDEVYASALSRFLQSRGYTTVVAAGSMTALREFETRDVDLVITEMRLRKGEPHGASLGRMIKRKNRKLPVIIVTAHPDLAEIEQPLPGPVFDKSMAVHELEQAVESALADK
jgi:DNA-binding NtrC family response regulator